MAEELFPVYDVPEVEEDEERYDTDYHRSMKWDANLGDFVRDGSGKVVEDDGESAYMTWCYKVSQTERFECLSYPDEIGTEIENATVSKERDVVESMIEKTVTEALMTNPRTLDVSDFEFDWDGDMLSASCTVSAMDIEDFRLTI